MFTRSAYKSFTILKLIGFLPQAIGVGLLLPLALALLLGFRPTRAAWLAQNIDDGDGSHFGLNQPLSDPVQILSSDSNYFLKVNLRDSRARFRVALANNDNGGLQTLSGIKSRFENQGYAEWAIVNGDLFSGNCPSGTNCAQGLTYIDGNRRGNWSQYGNTWMVRGNLGLDTANNASISVGDGQTRRNMTIGGGPRVLMNGGNPTCNRNTIQVQAKHTFLTQASTLMAMQVTGVPILGQSLCLATAKTVNTCIWASRRATKQWLK